jgi:predicted CDP-diglyceride synthetase/phosphatidate cytidylyltransferase
MVTMMMMLVMTMMAVNKGQRVVLVLLKFNSEYALKMYTHISNNKDNNNSNNILFKMLFIALYCTFAAFRL